MLFATVRRAAEFAAMDGGRGAVPRPPVGSLSGDNGYENVAHGPAHQFLGSFFALGPRSIVVIDDKDGADIGGASRPASHTVLLCR